MDKLTERYFPLHLVQWILALHVGVMLIWQSITDKLVYFIYPMFFGVDFWQYYAASQSFWKGKSMYAILGFVTPPVSALVVTPLAFMTFDVGKVVIFIFNLLAVPLAISLLYSHLFTTARKSQKNMAIGVYPYITTVVLLSLSYPYLYLVSRGNADGEVLLLVVLSLILMGHSEVLSGFLLALAIGIKVYPLLLLLPLLVFRRYRVVISTGIFLLVFVLLTPEQWYQYVTERLWRRSAVFVTRDNASIMSAFFFLGRLAQRILGGLGVSVEGLDVLGKDVVAPLVYAGALVVAALSDYRIGRPRDQQETILRVSGYFPFMVALPQLAIAYELIFLLALLPTVLWLWMAHTSPVARAILIVISLGIAFGQFHVIGLYVLSGRGTPFFFTSLGLLLTLMGFTGWKVYQTRTRPSLVASTVPSR